MRSSGKRWVIKIGSSLLTANGAGLDGSAISGWVDQIASLVRENYEIVLVSSGAIVEGMTRLNLKSRPASLDLLQAAAAVGQMGLIQIYESNFQRHNLHTAQVLLTHDNTSNRERYINARSTLRKLLTLGVIPVVNENDTVVTDEIRFGDNDTLAAMVANLIEADTLVVLTDQEGLYDADPRTNPGARLVVEMRASDASLDQMAGTGSSLGRGGMVSKVEAARIAARSGADTIIACGNQPGVILKIARGEVIGSRLTADEPVLASRKQWLATAQPKGRLVLDEGAVEVLLNSGSSLLPIGVKAVHGQFTRGEIVSCVSEQGREMARGLVNYSNAEAEKIIGHGSRKIEALLGYVGEEELIHRDNLVLV